MAKINHIITWEESYVSVENKKGGATVEISYNRFTRNYKITSPHENDNIKFTGDLKKDMMLMQALEVAMEYIKEQRDD